MRIGLAFDLKDAVPVGQRDPEDALAEYDCSETLGYITRAIQAAGHQVVPLGGGREFLENVLRVPVDFVFNIAEGRGVYRSREAQVPSVLEMLEIPYSGSDPLCLAVGLDKPLTKQIAADAGIRTPKWQVVSSLRDIRETAWQDFSYPVIVKPAWEGSSKGIHLDCLALSAEDGFKLAERLIATYRQPAMVEEFIDGEEITVGVIGNDPPRIVGIMRVVPRQMPEHFVYSVEVKKDWQNLVDYECPAKLGDDVLAQITLASLKTFKALGCRDVARLDFRVSPDGVPYFIEINPLPGLGDYSDIIIMAQKMGWSHEGLIRAILTAALERYPVCAPR